MGMGARSAGRHLISPQEISSGWTALYGATLGIQFVCSAIRALVAYVLLWAAFKLFGQSTAHVHLFSEIVGFGPLVLSFATLLLPLGGWLWQTRIGGRAPSERERLLYEDALAILRRADPNLRPPHRWFVLDEPYINAAAYADTLMLTRGLLDSGHLECVLAHELGHLNSSDARLTAALHRMTTPPRARLRPFAVHAVAVLATGAAGMWLMTAPWGAYWRAREFQADVYAARLDQGQALARFLEEHALENDLPVPFAWLSGHAHPSSEHRIDRLLQLEAEAAPDAGVVRE
jgi:Zn-dependent protease with chaperone function